MTKTENPRYRRWALIGAGLSILLFLVLSSFLLIRTFYSNFDSQHSQNDSKRQAIEISQSPAAAVVYQWSYAANSSYQASSGSTVAVICKALGHWTLTHQTSLLSIESFRCNDQDLAINRVYQFNPETYLSLDAKAISESSPINALALALSRELAIGKPKVVEGKWDYTEPRLEALIKRKVRARLVDSKMRWTKSYSGKIPSRPEISHHLEAQSLGISSPESNPRASIDEVSMKEVETIEIGGKLLSKSTVAIEIKRANASSFSLPILASQAPERLPLTAVKDLETERRKILLEWTKFLQDPPSSKAASDSLYVRLKLALRHDPALVSEFRHTLEQQAPDSEAFKLLLGALAYAGTDEATNTLVESANARGNDLAWQAAITSVLGLATKPTKASWDYLDSIRINSRDEDLRKGAELAMAGQIKQGMVTSQSKSFIKEVLDREAKGQSIYSILDVIGNAALETETPRLQKWAASSDPKLRSAVAESLRLMNSVESEQILLQLVSDPDRGVRRSAGQAFQTRLVSANALPILLITLQKSDDELLQLSLLETLYRSEALDPSLGDRLRDKRVGLDLTSPVKTRWIEIENALLRT